MDVLGVGNPASVRAAPAATLGAASGGGVSVRAISEAAFVRGAAASGNVIGPQTARPSERGAGTARDGDAAAGDGVRRSRDGDTAELASAGRGRTPSGEPLTDAEQREVDRLRARDAEVRTHEQAHVAAAGSLFRGGPTYEYETGPDGQRYAVGGSVSIDTSAGATPEETIARASQIRRAALAPAEPSSTDRAVAAQAARMEAEARAELAEESRSEPGVGGVRPDDEGVNGPRAADEAGASGGDDERPRDARVSAFEVPTAALESRLLDVFG